MKIIFTIVISLLLFNLSFAQIPGIMNYQGLLTDASGVPMPDGNYNLTFRIYDVATAGSALWTEAQLVLVESGVFNAMLGNSTALNLDFDVPYWMGIQVGADPELSPRIELTSSAYTFNSMNSEAVGGNTVSTAAPTTGEVLKWNGSVWAPGSDNAGTSVWTTSGDDIYNSNIGNVGIGTSAPLNDLHIVGGPNYGSIIVAPNSTVNDSSEIILAEDNDYSMGMSLLYNGSLNLLETFGKSGTTIYGPHMSIARNDGATIFSGSSVTFPADAISAPEIDDEPGVGSAIGSGMSLTGTGFDVQLSRSITCPTAGYVLVIASCEVTVVHAAGTTSNAYFGVSDNNIALPANQDIELRLSSTATAATYDFPVTVHGLFSAVAGVNTFYFLAREYNGNFDTYDIQLSLLFVPTAYGTVTPTKFNEGSDNDDDASQAVSLTAADIAAEQAEAQSFNQQRIERELAALRAEIEAIKAASRAETDN